MAHFRMFYLLLFITISCFEAQGADKYTDENRPYEFGFSIDGEQHRHEKKDENGIIMGEFGFITADGVYHVTVYATDENGNFKILSMKNIRVKPYPTYTANNDARKGHSLSLPPQAAGRRPSETPSQSTQSYNGKSTSELQPNSKAPPANPVIEPARACSSCSIPTTTTRKPSSAVNTQNDFSSPSGGNYVSKKFNGHEEPSNILSSNNQDYIPQSNKINSGIGIVPDISSNKENVGANNTQNNIGFSENQPSSESDQSFNEISRASTPLQPLQGSNPVQVGPYQNSGGSINLSQRFGGDSDSDVQSNNNENSNIGKNATPQNNNHNSVGLTPVQPSPGNNSQPISTYHDSGNDNFLQNVVRNPNINPVNVDNNSDSKNIPQNGNSISRSEYDQGHQPGDRNPKQLDSFSLTQVGRGNSGDLETSNFSKPQKPMLISAQMQIVDKNTDIYYKKPGEKEGLPNGITRGDMENLLYTFNYTLAFQGHYEEGFRSGAKQGYYFVTGRNGVRTRVDYVADENGFRPKITQEVLDLLSDDVPKPETEKDEEYGLRGYEFKWLYFPVETSKQQ